MDARPVKLRDKQFNAGFVVVGSVVAIVATGNMSCVLLLRGGHKLVVDGSALELVEEIFGSES